MKEYSKYVLTRFARDVHIVGTFIMDVVKPGEFCVTGEHTQITGLGRPQ